MSSEKQRIHADYMLDELKDKAREWGDLVKENRRLKEIEQEHQRINGELREENNRLNNIIEELKAILKSKGYETYIPVLEGSDKE